MLKIWLAILIVNWILNVYVFHVVTKTKPDDLVKEIEEQGLLNHCTESIKLVVKYRNMNFGLAIITVILMILF